MANFNLIRKEIKKPCIKKQLSSISVSDREVILRSGFWSGDSIILRTKKNISIAKLVGLLNGQHTWDNIFSQMSNDTERSEFKALVEGLHKNNLLFENNKKIIPKISIISLDGKSRLSKLLEQYLGKTKITSAHNADLVIICSEAVNLEKFHELNKQFLELNKPFIFVIIDGRSGIIGPTVIPHKTACFNCFELRLQSNMSAYETYQKLKSCEINSSVKDYEINFLASIAAYEILNYFEKNGATMNNALFVEFGSLNAELNPVYKIPRCEQCGAAKPAESPFVNLTEIVKEWKSK